MNVYQFIVGEEEEDIRLDVYLSNQLPDVSRNYIQKMISKEKVKINGQIETSKKFRVKQNTQVEIEIPDAEPLKIEPENIPIDIIYEDDDVIVVNKP
ncbi:MAG TPA: RNA pseudouridine synthase, partial [Clostridiales bacterium]|nr:RNA pseudouridine synthase [Clostridiales bacterium]